MTEQAFAFSGGKVVPKSVLLSVRVSLRLRISSTRSESNSISQRSGAFGLCDRYTVYLHVLWLLCAVH